MEVDGISLTMGGAAVSAVAGVAGALIKARYGKTKVEPTPLPVEKAAKFVTVQEFNKHVEDNARDHENLFGRLNRNDRETSEVKGMLQGMRDDLTQIKAKLFKTR